MIRWSNHPADGPEGLTTSQIDVDYLGFTVRLPIERVSELLHTDRFLELDLDSHRVSLEPDAPRVLAPPWLRVVKMPRHDHWISTNVCGGYANVLRAHKAGLTTIPLDVFPGANMRGRDVTPEMRRWPILTPGEHQRLVDQARLADELGESIQSLIR